MTCDHAFILIISIKVKVNTAPHTSVNNVESFPCVCEEVKQGLPPRCRGAVCWDSILPYSTSVVPQAVLGFEPTTF